MVISSRTWGLLVTSTLCFLSLLRFIGLSQAHVGLKTKTTRLQCLNGKYIFVLSGCLTRRLRIPLLLYQCYRECITTDAVCGCVSVCASSQWQEDKEMTLLILTDILWACGVCERIRDRRQWKSERLDIFSIKRWHCCLKCWSVCARVCVIDGFVLGLEQYYIQCWASAGECSGRSAVDKPIKDYSSVSVHTHSLPGSHDCNTGQRRRFS